MLIGTIQHLNTQSTVLTNSSLMVASVVYGEWRWQPNQNLLFYPLYSLLVSLNAEVLVVVVVVGCVPGSWSQVTTFSCYSNCLSLTQNASKGYETIFKNLCYNTDKVCFAKTASPAPVFVQIPGSHHPGTRLRLVPGFRDPGSVLILGQVTQYGNPYLICITSVSLWWLCINFDQSVPPY